MLDFAIQKIFKQHFFLFVMSSKYRSAEEND